MAEDQVYVGPWINWKEGRVLGATITISGAYGNLLVAFLAIYVGWVGAHAWGILCYTLHQLRSTTNNCDGLHHQQQAILRNSLAPSAVLWRLFRLGWAWRHNTKGAIRRNSLLLFICVLHIVAFISAAAFSSRVTSRGANEALIKSSLCGWPDDHVITNFGNWTSEEIKIADNMFVMAHESYREAATYVRSCYGDVKSSYSSMCDSYVTTRIESYVEETAPCPFADGTCMTPAISIDSGLLDSDLDLGITATAGNRVQVRKAITCAPIPAEQEYSVGNITVTPDLNETSGQVYYYLGRNLGEDTRFTYSVTNMSFLFATEPYVLRNFNAFADNVPESEFMPIPDFQRADADVSLLFLNRALVYTEEVTDPWLSASVPVDVDGWGVKWISALATTAVGCVEEYQLCNGCRCRPSSGLYGMNETSARAIGYNPAQMATFHIVWKALWSSQIRYLLTGLGTDVLLAKDKLYTSLHRLSPTLPPNQWHMEMSNIYNISMALLQRRVVEHASPPQFRIRGFDADKYIIPETSSESLRLCSLQRIRSSRYSSFSVLGLTVIVVAGLLIIILNVLLVDIVAWFRRKAARGLTQNREWIESETLQLQRMLSEAQGIGPWKGQQDAVPVTVKFGQDFRLGKGIEEEENGI